MCSAASVQNPFHDVHINEFLDSFKITFHLLSDNIIIIFIILL